MKREIAILLALAMIFALCACGTVRKAEPTHSPTPVPTTKSVPTPTATPKATPSPTPVPKLTRDEAYDYLKKYLNNNEDELVRLLENKSGVKYKKVSLVKIATISDGCGMLYGSDDYGFTIKGKFWGEDAYGRTEGEYIFEWAAVVDYPLFPTPDHRADVRLATNIGVKKA